MIIFSQGPTLHSRIGNSIDWMTRAQFYADAVGVQVAFPWAHENFNKYLKPHSYWLKNQTDAEGWFEKKFHEKLTAVVLSSTSRKIESRYERENNLAAFDWTEIVFEDVSNDILYLTGTVDLSEDRIVKLIKKYPLTICHEPFNFKYRANFLLIGEDYSGVAPCNSLFDQQRDYVKKVAGENVPVGVHIRRGDYIKWQNGAYYYDDAYWCRNVSRLVDDGKSVWVFSNELTDGFSRELGAIGAHVSNESFEIDFVRLMQMHTVYGPPSTFSAKALAVHHQIYGLKKNLVYLPKIS